MPQEVSPMSRRDAALTYRDYAALPNDGRRYEIHDGELSVTPAPNPQHQICAANLFRVLDNHVRSNNLGLVLFAPLDVILSDTTIVQPDLVYLPPDRLGTISRRGIEGPPLLAIEIRSPSTAAIDRDVKYGLYARHGVPCFWLLDPDERVIEAYRLEGGRYTLALRASGATPVDPPPFQGLALVPASLWP
jgi:Uma2 family endonuclease